ncbi:MAG: prephenate dehydrogenase/arogenate dehydrogenase family protein [Pseudonocardiaceae bacterium]
MNLIQGRCEMLQRCVVVGGAGAVGDMFAQLLEDAGAQVCVLDITPPDVVGSARRFERADITMLNQQVLTELGEADLVLLAVSERVALAAIASVHEALKPGALLAETLSVKSRVTAVVRTDAPRTEVVGLNPMFAPSLGMAGNPVAAVVTHGGPRTCELLRLVTAWGGRVVRMDAEEHDRVVTAVQVLTHAAVLAFGFALAELDIGIEELSALASPPHAMMLALLARIVSGTPEVYWDVQSANLRAPEAREALIRGARQLADHIATGDETAFVKGLLQTRAALGGELDRYRELCAQAFDLLRRPH